MVLLVGRGGQAGHAAGVGQALVLGGQCGSGYLGNHEAGVHTAVSNQEGWQARQARIEQQRHAALRDRTDLGHGQRNDVGRKGHGLGVEVAARDDLARVGEHQRVVRCGIGLDAQHACGVLQVV